MQHRIPPHDQLTRLASTKLVRALTALVYKLLPGKDERLTFEELAARRGQDGLVRLKRKR